mgnify:CR=1 FL=1
MNSKFTLPIGLLAGALCILFNGCMPKPQTLPPNPPKTSQKVSLPAQGPLGGFNLQKRHGLGAWEGKPGPTEQQLLRQMAHGNSTNTPQPAPSKTNYKTLPGKETP